MPKIDEITLVLIVAVLAMIIGVHNKTNTQKEIDAEKLSYIITDNHDLSFASDGIINQNKLKDIQKMNYEELKNYLNVKNDFCIYIEDGNGNIILAKGSSKLNRDGIYCRE